MSLETGVAISFFVVLYGLFKFQDSLADGEHQMLKFGISGFSLVIIYQLTIMMADFAQEAATPQAGIVGLTGNFVWVFGTGMVVIFMYFLYHLIISYLDWRNWRKSKNPFSNTEKRYFK